MDYNALGRFWPLPEPGVRVRGQSVNNLILAVSAGIIRLNFARVICVKLAKRNIRAYELKGTKNPSCGDKSDVFDFGR